MGWRREAVMASRKRKTTKLDRPSDEDQRILAGMRIAMRMAQLPEDLVQMLSPNDLRRLSALERAAYLRLADGKGSRE